MTVSLSSVGNFSVDGAEIKVSDRVVQFTGVISMRTPSAVIGPFLEKIHQTVIAARLSVLERH